MNNITWSCAFLFWYLSLCAPGLQQGRRECCVWAATEPFVLNNLPAIWRPESKPRPRGTAAAAAVHLRFNWEHFVSLSLPRINYPKAPTAVFSKTKLMHQTQDLIRFRRAEEQSRWRSFHPHFCSHQFFCQCHQGTCNCFLPFHLTPLRAPITWRPLRAVIL